MANGSLLPELSESFRRSGESYTQKLNQYAGIFQTVKQSQVAKQQMQQELERQMEMAEFQSDLQLDRQMEYYEQVQKPQLQAEQQQQAAQQQMERFENVQTRARDMQEEFYGTYGDVADYNLFQPRFRPTFNQDGTPQLGIYRQQGDEAQPITEEEYRFRLNKLEEAAQFLRDLEKNKGDLGESRTYVEDGTQIQQIGRDNVNQFIRDIKFNEEARNQFLNRFFNEQIERAPVVEEEGEGSGSLGIGDTGVSDALDVATGLNNIYLNEDEIFNEEPNSVIKDNWVFNEDVDLPVITTSDSPGAVRTEVNKFFNNNWGVDISAVDNIPEGDLNKILNGESSGFESESAGSIANVFDDFSQSDRKKLENYLVAYRDLKKAYRFWAREFGEGGVKSIRDVRYNPNFEDPRNMFVPIDSKPMEDFREAGRSIRQQ